MADIQTDVMIVGTGPAGGATAALLATYGVETFVINRYRWLASTPRAHIMVAASLNHSGPMWEAEPGWSRKVVKDAEFVMSARSGVGFFQS